MIFKSSTVALVVSSVLAVSANASDVQKANQQLSVGNTTNNQETSTDIKSALVISKESTGVYFIQLTEKSALDASHAKLGNNRSSVLAKVDAQQATLLDTIRSLDSSSVLTRKARLTENALYMQLSHEAAKQLANNINIAELTLLSEEPSYTAADEFKAFPFLTIKDAGDAVTVAIIGNGVDYTHESLGGSGNYDQAWANKSNAWDGFPTDTVIGGLDFSAGGEGYHTIDYNPIEDAEDTNVENGYIASGTAVAAQILAQAPEAKILSYKTWDWASSYFFPVLDVIIDPNQDGDISDRPDVIVLNAYGNGAFYVEDDTNGSSPTREINLVRRLSAAGSLVVVGAGDTYFNSYFNVAWRGAVPEALTVGSVGINGDNIVLSEFTPAGPVRGTHQLKPEVVAPAENIVAPIAGSGDAEGQFEANSTYAAAYAAGTVAKILAEYPQLSPLEAKALIANTAISDNIKGSVSNVEVEGIDRVITTVAEVPFMGTGLVNGDAAVSANAVVWETSSYQPGMAFGFVEASSSATVSRDVTIRNLTDKVQTYALSNMANGDKSNNAAISFVFPETVNVPANHSIVFNVTMKVDATKLTEQAFSSTDDHTIANFTKANVNGYLVFTSTDKNSAQLKMPWQVFPKNSTPLSKTNLGSSGWEMPYEANDWMARVWAAMGNAGSEWLELTNDSNQTKTVYTMPRMHTVSSIKDSKASGQGNMIKNIGASIVAEQSCAAGSKVSIAVQMFDKFDVPMAEHFDKAGHVLTYFSVFTGAYVDSMNGDAQAIDSDMYRTDNDVLAYVEVLLDNDGKPRVEYVDYDEEYEWWNPRKRFKQSSLGADVSIGDDTVVANICLEDLYHGEIQSADAWDDDLGWQFATDRDAQADVGETVIRYNPVIMGRAFTEIIDHTGEYNYPPWTYTNCDANGVDWNGNPFPEDYCIEEKSTFLASHTGIAKLAEDEAAELIWSNKVDLAPGEAAKISVTVVDECNPNIVSIGGSWQTNEQCPPGVMIFELGNDNTGFADTDYGSDIGVKPNQGFTVYENAENGTVIGQLAQQSVKFFTADKYEGPIHLVNALPGTPFNVATDGTITVANSDVLDFEQTKSYILKVQADYVNRDTQIVDVLIKINNRNDVAPVMLTGLAAINGEVDQKITTSISSAFSDVEGDGITFSSSNLPEGLTLSNAGTLSGTLTQVGDYQASINATDGINTTTAQLNFSVGKSSTVTPPGTDPVTTPIPVTPPVTAPITTPDTTPVTTPDPAPEADPLAPEADESSSGGSTGIIFFILAGLAFFNRRIGK